MDDFKPKADNPLHKAAKGSLIGQFGVEGGGVRARADLAFVKLRAECSVCLAGENDLVCVWSHWDYASQLVVGVGRQHAWQLGLSRHPIPGDPGQPGRCRSAICTAELPRPMTLDELRRGALVGPMQPAG